MSAPPLRALPFGSRLGNAAHAALCVAAVLLVASAAPSSAQLSEPIEWALINDAGAAPDTKYVKNHVKFQVHPETGWGFVPYRYWMQKWELKTVQYVDFLNSVACADSGEQFYGLWEPRMASLVAGCDPSWDPVANPGPSHTCWPGTIERTGSFGGYAYRLVGGDERLGELPFNRWTYWRAIKFANWLDNGQPDVCAGGPHPESQNPGTTEDGSYTITGLDLRTAPPVPRNPRHLYYVASYDELYKAAHHVPWCRGADCYNCYAVAGTVTPTNAECDELGHPDHPRPPSSYPGCPDCEAPFDPLESVNNPGDGNCNFTSVLPTLPRDLSSNPEDPYLDLRAACDLWWAVGTYRRTSSWGVAELHGGMNVVTETPLVASVCQDETRRPCNCRGGSYPCTTSPVCGPGVVCGGAETVPDRVMASPQLWLSSGWDHRAVSTTSFDINSGGSVHAIGTRFVRRTRRCGLGFEVAGALLLLALWTRRR